MPPTERFGSWERNVPDTGGVEVCAVDGFVGLESGISNLDYGTGVPIMERSGGSV